MMWKSLSFWTKASDLENILRLEGGGIMTLKNKSILAKNTVQGNFFLCRRDYDILM